MNATLDFDTLTRIEELQRELRYAERMADRNLERAIELKAEGDLEAMATRLTDRGDWLHDVGLFKGQLLILGGFSAVER